MNIRKGDVQSFNATAYTAVVRLAGSLAVSLSDVPVARNIAPADMVAGRSCAVLSFDESNPEDAVVIAVYV